MVGVFRRLSLFILVFSIVGFSVPKDCAYLLAEETSPTFGYEVEYVPGEHPNLWTWYRPDFISEEQWAAWDSSERDRVIESRSEEIAPTRRVPSRLVRLSSAPGFLPERLIKDDTGNWEIIGGVSRTFLELEQNLKIVESQVGPGSYQAHAVDSIERLQRGAAGYTLFSADLLTFRKFTSQLERYEKDSSQVPGAFFLHPFLSVYTRIKKEMLLAVIDANLQGKSWSSVVSEFRSRYPHLYTAWRENRPYYKYTLANTYRTDIYGNLRNLMRWGFEVRGAHKSLKALLEEVRVIAALMQKGFGKFERFIDVGVTDTLSFEASFTPDIRTLIQSNIPVVEADDPKPNYFVFLLRPFEQYVSLLDLTSEEARELRKDILSARTHALESLQALTTEARPKEKIKEELMVLLARFCKETGLLPYLERFQKRAIENSREVVEERKAVSS